VEERVRSTVRLLVVVEGIEVVVPPQTRIVLVLLGADLFLRTALVVLSFVVASLPLRLEALPLTTVAVLLLLRNLLPAALALLILRSLLAR